MSVNQAILGQIAIFVRQDLVKQAHDVETQEVFPQDIWQKLLSHHSFFDLLTQEDERAFRTFLEGLRLLASESPSLSAIA